jgi:hypothetical protein
MGDWFRIDCTFTFNFIEALMSQQIKAVCSYCREVYREGKLINGKATHGICPRCFEIEMKKIDEPEYLPPDEKKIQTEFGEVERLY